MAWYPKSLKTIYGARSVLTKNTITKYFNHPESLPFIARYRNETTLRGGFLDRILDGIGFVFVMSSFSWFTYQSSNKAYYLVLGPMAAAFYLIICYSYWTIAYHEQKYIGKTNKVRPGGNAKRIQYISTLKMGGGRCVWGWIKFYRKQVCEALKHRTTP